MIYQKSTLILTLLLTFNFSHTQLALSLPPPEDIPEEILRSEIVLEARSPVDGKPISINEYVQTREELAQSQFPPNLSSEIKHQVFMLQLLKFFRTFTPF